MRLLSLKVKPSVAVAKVQKEWNISLDIIGRSDFAKNKSSGVFGSRSIPDGYFLLNEFQEYMQKNDYMICKIWKPVWAGSAALDRLGNDALPK
ncbi:hypothetical protein CTI12_AA507580 [Artemisia annua]|uniref:Uncharacterized protein n=1 Tax=Artemisia annua TaxID=35608 RepID=A0A2U1L8G0_ARTAN|nr:hypothetical protein CTI12_AA507580 [Artemisia annua]